MSALSSRSAGKVRRQNSTADSRQKSSRICRILYLNALKLLGNGRSCRYILLDPIFSFFAGILSTKFVANALQNLFLQIWLICIYWYIDIISKIYTRLYIYDSRKMYKRDTESSHQSISVKFSRLRMYAIL